MGRLSRAAGLFVVLAVSCGDEGGGERDGAVPPLADSPTLPRVTNEDAVRTVLEAVRRDHYPELEGVTIVVEPADGVSFFASNLTLDTLDRAPRERRYRIQVGRALFADPPSNRAVYAILTHELRHTVDYLGMDGKTLAKFGIDYALLPQTDYERATDRHALDRGVGRGLADYRRWLYAHVDDETRAEKIRDYYTPEQIEAYLRDHPTPDRTP